MILTLPPLGLFLGIYFTTENLVLGAVIGFGVHFVILAFSGRISKAITKVMSLTYMNLHEKLMYHDGEIEIFEALLKIQ